MCGIAGLFRKDGADRGTLERMTGRLVHRGPDASGHFVEGAAGLGHRRLSIIDLETGDQPMFNEEGTVLVVFNGEIYNFRELREGLEASGHRFRTASDTEVIVHLYEEHGDRFPAKLNGIFAFAIYDRARKRLLLARDPLGVKPLYYASTSGGLAFASELRSLAAGVKEPMTEDREALALYLQMEYYPAPLTPFREAKKLLPGHYLAAEGPGEFRVESYGAMAFGDLSGETEEDLARRVRDEVIAAVGRQLVSDVPLGVFLSGGVDSSAVTAAMKALGTAIRSFSIGFEDPDFDESRHAERAAAHLGTTHFERSFTEKELLGEVPRILSCMDEPLADPSLFPTALLSRFARENVKVALGGDGGDELFCGYPTYTVHRYYPLYRSCPRFLRRPLLEMVKRLVPAGDGNLTLGYKAMKFSDGAEKDMPERHLAFMGAFSSDKLSRLMPGVSIDTSPLSWIGGPPFPDGVTEAQWLDLRTYMMEDVLQKVDRMSMLSSLEVRVPLLDLEVVKLAFSIPPRKKMKGLRLKTLLKRAFEKDFPPGFFERPKKGFAIPLSRWMKGPLREFTEDAIGIAPSLFPGVDGGEVRRIWSDHLEGKADNRKLVWTLVALSAWKSGMAHGR